MAKPWEIDEEHWLRVSALLPVHRPGKRGPVPLDDRKCLQGIWFVLYTGINCSHLPKELSFGSGITCWRRFRRWCEAGVWDRLHRLLLSELHALGEIDWFTVCLDGSQSTTSSYRPSNGCRHRAIPARRSATSPTSMSYNSIAVAALGAMLLEAVNEHARKAPLETLIVWPSERSDPLYRRHGYTVGGELLEQHVND